MLTVHVLGRVEMRRDGTPLDLGGPQQRAVVAHLALDVGRVVPVDRLVDRLWGDELPRTPLGTLQSYVSRLRRAIEPERAPGAPAEVLVSEAPGYVLALPADHVDVHRFTSLVEQARAAREAGDAVAATELLDHALGLWTGPPLAGIGPADVLAPIVAGLDEARMSAIDDRFDTLLDLGRHHDVIAGLQAAVAEQPLRERRRAQLALALYRSSRQSEALRSLASAREVLAEELGLDPGPELRELERRILEQDPGLLPGPIRPPRATIAERPRRPAVDLVGRSDEWSQLVAALDAVESNGPRLVLVVGDAGIGKSTICRAFVAEAEVRGWRTAVGRCVESGLAPSLWPCIELVRDILRDAPPDPTNVLHRLTSSDETPERTLAPVELADQFLLLVDELGAGRWVFWLDDLHWADQPTLDLVRLVLERLGDRRVLLLAAHRPVEAVLDSLLGEALGSYARAGAVDRVAMSPLDRDGVATLLERATGVAPPADVVDRVHDRAGGNPLFVAEFGRLFGERGAVDPGAVPDAIRDVVRRRLAPLPESTRAEIEIAAIVGERFDLATVMAASERDPDACLDALDTAIVTRVIVPDGDGWRFAHALVRDAVLADVSPLRRARLHHRVAEALREQHGSSLDAAEPIAHHRLGSLPVADRLVVATDAVRAADVARWRGAFDSSESYAEQALAIVGALPRTDEVSQVELDALQALAGVSYLRGGTQPKGVVEGRVASLAERIGSDAVRALALFLNWGDVDEADSLDEIAERTEQARELAGRTDDRYATVLTNYMLGSEALLRGRVADARDHLRAALVAVRDHTDPGADRPRTIPLPGVPTVSAIAHVLAGDRETALDLVDREAAIWMEERSRIDPSIAVTLGFGRVVVRALLDDPVGVAAITGPLPSSLLDQSIEALTCRVLGGWSRVRRGDADGIVDAVAALADHDRGPNRVLESWLRTCVADALLHLDDERAVELLERADAEARSRGEVWWLAETLRLRAVADDRFGSGAAAAAWRSQARRLAIEQGSALLLARMQSPSVG